MHGNIAKAYAISDAKISFVSLVGKAANKHKFLITKSEDGKASFATYGSILKADSTAHLVTGIVYEPMVEDTDGNYMTEEEITKAAHWFAKNGNQVDLQHSFEPLEGAVVVESSVTKCDMELEGQPIKKGTWLMTVELQDENIFQAIEKGEITGFSMGGIGAYSEVNTDLADPENPVAKSKKKGLFKQMAELFGFDVVEKGKVKDRYANTSVHDDFWNAFYALSDSLIDIYNPETERWEFQSDETKIREALEDFNEIVTNVLTTGNGVFKSASIEKSGKALSAKNKETLKAIHENLGAFLENFEEKEEETEVTEQEIQKIAKAAVAEYVAQQNPKEPVKKEETPVAKEEPVVKQEENLEALIEKAVNAAVSKAFGEEEPEETPSVEEMVEKAVEKAMQPFMKQARLSTQPNVEGVEKSEEEHYLHGII